MLGKVTEEIMAQSRRKMHKKLPKLEPRTVMSPDSKPLSFTFTPAMVEAAKGPYTDIDREHELRLGRPMKPSERLLRIAINDAHPTEFITAIEVSEDNSTATMYR